MDPTEDGLIGQPIVRPMAVPHIPRFGARSEMALIGQDRGVPVTIPPSEAVDDQPVTPDIEDRTTSRSSDDESVLVSSKPTSELDSEQGAEDDPTDDPADGRDSEDEAADEDDQTVEIERLTVQEAAKAANKTARTVRRWVSSGRLPAIQVDGAYLVARDELEEFLEDLAETEASKPAPKAPEIPTGLIPIDTVNNIIEEMSRLHRERTEAIERAARAEERERFQAERRRIAEEHLEEVQRLHREAEQAREAARQADLPPPDIGHGGPELSSDSREDGEEASVPMSATVSEAPSGKRPGRVRSAWRVLWASNPQENDPPPQGPPGQMAEHGEEGPGGAHGM